MKQWMQNAINRVNEMFSRGVISAKQKALLVAAILMAAAQGARAQSNIDGVLDSLDGYKTAGIALGVAILLFTLGRAIVRKLGK